MESSKVLLNSLDHLGGWGVFTTDVGLRITGWNRWLEQRSGKVATDVMGRHLFEIYPDLVIRSLDRYYRQALDGHACILSQRFHKFLLPLPPTVSATQLMHMQQTARLMPMLKDGAICGTLTLIEDVTERIVTEEELRKQADRLEEANRHKDEFLAMLAHELRNPLAPIRNGIRVLDLVPSDSFEARQTREMMERQVGHMVRLVDDLLDVSRIAQGKVRLRQELCDMTTIVRDVVNDYRPLIEENKISISLSVPNVPCEVQGDRIRLSQILGNLLHNANKFTNAGGEIRVSCEVDQPSKNVIVRVTDTGIGMSRETLSRVFDTFSQADVSLDRSKGGLGLGLSLARGLTSLHGGSLVASSDGLAKGSTFTLQLPLVEARTPAVPTLGPPTEVAAESQRILVIEDSRAMSMTLKVLLTRLGHEVECADSGMAGLELASHFRPNIVLCDIGLPGKDGYEVARALRAHSATNESYLIAQSGYGQDEDIKKSHDAGFDLHLTKPVDFAQLKRVLSTAPIRCKS